MKYNLLILLCLVYSNVKADNTLTLNPGDTVKIGNTQVVCKANEAPNVFQASGYSATKIDVLFDETHCRRGEGVAANEARQSALSKANSQCLLNGFRRCVLIENPTFKVEWDPSVSKEGEEYYRYTFCKAEVKLVGSQF